MDLAKKEADPLNKMVRSNSIGEVTLKHKDKIQRKKIMNAYPHEIEQQMNKRLKDVDKLFEDTEERIRREPVAVNVNSECVFFGTQHKHKVNDLTRKQVLNGIEKNYMKFKDQYSHIVNKNPHIILDHKIVEQDYNDNIVSQAVHTNRPISVEYLQEDRFQKPLLTDIEKEKLKGNQKRTDSAVSVRKRFIPELKVIKTGTSKPREKKALASDSSILKVDIMRYRKPVSHIPHRDQKQSTYQLPLARLPPNKQSLSEIKMRDQYRKKYGDMIVDIEMTKKVREKMYKNIYERYDDREERARNGPVKEADERETGRSEERRVGGKESTGEKRVREKERDNMVKYKEWKKRKELVEEGERRGGEKEAKEKKVGREKDVLMWKVGEDYEGKGGVRSEETGRDEEQDNGGGDRAKTGGV